MFGREHKKKLEKVEKFWNESISREKEKSLEVANLKKVLEEKENKIKELEDKLADTNSDTNSVLIKISDDLTSIVPIVRYNPEILEKLLEMGYIRETGDAKHDGFAIQIALIDIAKDGLIQIIDAFSEPAGD